jgi:ATP-dependent protease Clp ATPase subunit
MADDKPNPCDQQDEERKVRLKRWTQEILRFHQTPEEIASGLRLHVIGQGEGVRAVAALLRRQMRRLQRAIERNPDRVWPGPPGESTPTLLIGPTGCGKTLLVRTLAKIAGLPYVIEDATSMSETGYYGRSVHNMLEQLASRADPLISMTQATHGIAAIDEVDKVARRPAQSTYRGKACRGRCSPSLTAASCRSSGRPALRLVFALTSPSRQRDSC